MLIHTLGWFVTIFGLYENKIASKLIYHKDNKKTTKQANKNASCPEEALIYEGC